MTSHYNAIIALGARARTVLWIEQTSLMKLEQSQLTSDYFWMDPVFGLVRCLIPSVRNPSDNNWFLLLDMRIVRLGAWRKQNTLKLIPFYKCAPLLYTCPPGSSPPLESNKRRKKVSRLTAKTWPSGVVHGSMMRPRERRGAGCLVALQEVWVLILRSTPALRRVSSSVCSRTEWEATASELRRSAAPTRN